MVDMAGDPVSRSEHLPSGHTAIRREQAHLWRVDLVERCVRRHAELRMGLEDLGHKVPFFLDLSSSENMRAHGVVSFTSEQARAISHQAEAAGNAVEIFQTGALRPKKAMSLVDH